LWIFTLVLLAAALSVVPLMAAQAAANECHYLFAGTGAANDKGNDFWPLSMPIRNPRLPDQLDVYQYATTHLLHGCFPTRGRRRSGAG
jgi:hypothetical protein